MNKICVTCDTRNRLKKCNGKDGDFRYCMRKVGSTEGLEETITQFNSPREIFENNKSDYVQGLDADSLYLDSEPYGFDNTMCLMYGKWKGFDEVYPVAFVTKDPDGQVFDIGMFFERHGKEE